MSQLKTIHWKSLPGAEDITRVELDNGITVLTRSNYDSPSVRISGYLQSGSRFDPEGKLGLAYTTALALMRGTRRYSFQETYDILESVGASLGFGSNVHTVSFGAKSLVEDLPVLLGMLSECLRNPIFPADQLEKLRAQLLTGLAIRNQRTDDMASLTFDKVVFGDHPYGKPVDGFPETIRAFEREDLVSFHQKNYGPNGMVLVVVGGVSPQEVIEQAQNIFGNWQNSKQSLPEALPIPETLSRTIREHIPLAGKSQSDLVMGTLGPRRSSPDYPAASLGNSILGRFGMMGRIGDVVREQSGLAYYASANLSASIAAGSWEVSAGVNPANLQRAIDLIILELRRFVKEPVTQEELEDNQSYFVGSLPMMLESNVGVAGALVNIERFQLGLDYYRNYPSMIEKLTPEIILETARKYIDPEKLAICSAGAMQEI